MTCTPVRLAILLAFFLAIPAPSKAQPPDQPYEVDESTLTLWHFDTVLPESLTTFSIGDSSIFEIKNAITALGGGFLVAGRIRDRNNEIHGAALMKLSDDCRMLWLKQYQPNNLGCLFYDLEQAGNGDIHLIGYARYFNGNQNLNCFWLMSTNEDGDSLSSSSFPFENQTSAGSTLLLLEDGMLLCGTMRNGEFNNFEHLRLIRIDQNGEVEWDNIFDSTDEYSVVSAIGSNDGHFLIICMDETEHAHPCAIVTKISNEGEELWVQRYRVARIDEETISSCFDPITIRNGYLLPGLGSVDVQNEEGEQFVDKLFRFITIDEDGIEQARQYVDVGFEVNHVIEAQEGGYLASGGWGRMGLVKFSLELETEWSCFFRPAQSQRNTQVLQRNDRGLILVGLTARDYGRVSGWDMLVLATSPVTSHLDDNSGNLHNGEINGDISKIEGLWGDGIGFLTDSLSFISIEDNGWLRPEELTIECWFRSTLANHDYTTLIAKGSEDALMSFNLYTGNFDDYIAWEVSTDSGFYEVYHEMNPDDDQWHNVVAAHDGNRIWLIVDGNFEGDVQQTEAPGSILYSDEPITIGCVLGPNPIIRQFSGIIDEVRISNQARWVPSGVNKSDTTPLLPTFDVSSPFPNPFNSSTTISYSLPVPGNVSLALYDHSGRSVRELGQGYGQAGTHRLVLDASDLTSGLYFVRLNAGGTTLTERVQVIR